MMKMSNGEIMHTWSQTEMFGLNQNFGLIEEQVKPLAEMRGTQTPYVRTADVAINVVAESK